MSALSTATRNPLALEDGSQARRQVARAGVADVAEHTSAAGASCAGELDQLLLLGIEPVRGQGRRPAHDLAVERVDDDFLADAGVWPRQQRLQVSAKEPP